MGAQMGKELGLYNEEEKVGTPLGPQRYRLLNSDPRSATLGITRTPIQVECTPTGIKLNQKKENDIEAKESFTEDTEQNDKIGTNNNCKMDIDNSYELADHLSAQPQAEQLETKLKTEPLETKPKTVFLETDIDKLDSPTANETPCQSAAQKPTLELFDVRSPTVTFSRTPVLVECTPELFALHSRIERLSFCDFDVDTEEPSVIALEDQSVIVSEGHSVIVSEDQSVIVSEDPSVIVSDDDQTSQHSQSTVKNWLAGIEDKVCSDTPLNNSFAESPKKVSKKLKEINALKKQLFFTPDVKELAKPKVRTPLGNLQAGQLQDSPQKMMRTKQWRNIQEERQRLGIQDSENTPPNLPPLSKVASAPGKMLDRKRSKINWDEENTLVI